VLRYTGSLDTHRVFARQPNRGRADPHLRHHSVVGDDFTCICLFIGAMGKSAQVPLHIWLPDSMEAQPHFGADPCATMVTAGIFMWPACRRFRTVETALSFVLVIGSTTAFFMAARHRRQRHQAVVAYSTLSQLGYMTVALGVSAYSAGFFNLMTHAFFKALLFLAAGSVIIAMHHEQDMRKMVACANTCPSRTGPVWWMSRADWLSRQLWVLLQGFTDRCRGRLASRMVRICVFLRGQRRLHHRAVHLPHVSS